VDRGLVRSHFGRGAAAYDAQARVQREVVERFLLRLSELSPTPRRALDVGAGTGHLLARLCGAHPGLEATGLDLAAGMARAAREAAPAARWLLADAEALPFAAGTFDLVVSTSALQWLPRLDRAFAEARRVLAPGGVLAVALFGGETLWELRAAWREALPAGAPDRTHCFPSAAQVEAALCAAGLSLPAATAERIVERHADVPHLLRSLRAIGAGNAAPGGPPLPGLGARRVTERMMRAYQARHGGPSGVPATYEVVTAVARR